jgi:hypothetical protein
MKKMILANNRIAAASRMVWIPDPPAERCQKLKQVSNYTLLKFQPFFFRSAGAWEAII